MEAFFSGPRMKHRSNTDDSMLTFPCFSVLHAWPLDRYPLWTRRSLGTVHSDVEITSECSEAERYRAAWASYRRRSTAFWIATLLWMPVACLVAAFVPDQLEVTGVLGLFATWFFLAIRRMAWKCPRCDKPFFRSLLFQNPFARRCVNCRLPKWTTEEPGPENAPRLNQRVWPLDPVSLTANIASLITFTSVIGFAVALLVVGRVGEVAPDLSRAQAIALNEIVRVIEIHSLWSAGSGLLLALAAHALRRGVRGAKVCARAALVFFYLVNCWAWLDPCHGWRATCLAFDELFRGAPVYAETIAPVMNAGVFTGAAAGLVLVGWLFILFGRAKGECANAPPRPAA